MTRAWVIGATLLVAACGTEDRPLRPEDFAWTSPLKVTEQGDVQRIELNAAALAAFRRSDRGDIRVFDGNGRPLAIALIDEAERRADTSRLDAIPFESPSDKSLQTNGVSVRIDTPGQAMMVDASDTRRADVEQSVLFDTRKLAGATEGLVLDADLPIQRAVTFSVAQGDDLKSWRPIAEATLFRPSSSAAALLGSGEITLPRALLSGTYVRVTWPRAPGVQVRAGTFKVSHPSAPQAQFLPVDGLKLNDAHHVDFELPEGTAVSGFRVRLNAKDGVVPIRLLGRSTPELPWVPLAVASLRQSAKWEQLVTGPVPYRAFRLEADARTPGFSAVPLVEARLDPVTLLVALNGTRPFVLAVGHPSAPPIFLSAAELGQKLAPIPDVQIEPGATATQAVIKVKTMGHGVEALTLVLWGSLLLGVAALAAVAWRLFKDVDRAV